jgi:flagellar biosynthesis/type III secretory pathway ATPase
MRSFRFLLNRARDWRRIRDAAAIYRQSESLIQLGAYLSSANPKLDASIRTRDQLQYFLRQDVGVKCEREETLRQLQTLSAMLP